jgi:hypothetical protein
MHSIGITFASEVFKKREQTYENLIFNKKKYAVKEGNKNKLESVILFLII